MHWWRLFQKHIVCIRWNIYVLVENLKNKINNNNNNIFNYSVTHEIYIRQDNIYVTRLIPIQGDSESSLGKSEFEFVLGETRIPIYTGFNLV
jgi:hypothetical protein